MDTAAFPNQCEPAKERLVPGMIISWDIIMNWQVPTKYDILLISNFFGVSGQKFSKHVPKWKILQTALKASEYTDNIHSLAD